jgi:3-phosphoshikimate 1-carboxyvinyltransferase
MSDPRIGALIATRRGAIKGKASTPGDKSISHRALILGAMADGETRISGLLEGEDVLRTAAAMRALGAEIERDLSGDSAAWRVAGAPWRTPDRTLYFGNSGTGCRLIMGAVAGRGISARFDGDESLRRRPMKRVTAPLAAMGAAIATQDGRLPASVEPRNLKGINYVLPVASAQVKSAVLLAGLGASGATTIVEPTPSRDHTERMLRAFGVTVETGAQGQSRKITLKGGQPLTGASIIVPGDPSSAAFLAAAAAITPGSEVTLTNILINPLRTGFYETLAEMGASISFDNRRETGGEPVADMRVRYAPLSGVEVPPARAASMIDEYPILAVVAAFAKGDTLMRGVEELRVKESDRLSAIEAGLAANGVAHESGADWLCVRGRDGDVAGGGTVETRLDHRIAMSFLVMGLASRRPVTVDDGAMIATSFPDFVTSIAALGGRIEPAPIPKP